MGFVIFFEIGRCLGFEVGGVVGDSIFWVRLFGFVL